MPLIMPSLFACCLFPNSALSEKIVSVLPRMKCPHQLEPHQIQGMDFIHIFPVVQVRATLWFLVSEHQISVTGLTFGPSGLVPGSNRCGVDLVAVEHDDVSSCHPHLP